MSQTVVTNLIIAIIFSKVSGLSNHFTQQYNKPPEWYNNLNETKLSQSGKIRVITNEYLPQKVNILNRSLN